MTSYQVDLAQNEKHKINQTQAILAAQAHLGYFEVFTSWVASAKKTGFTDAVLKHLWSAVSVSVLHVHLWCKHEWRVRPLWEQFPCLPPRLSGHPVKLSCPGFQGVDPSVTFLLKGFRLVSLELSWPYMDVFVARQVPVNSCTHSENWQMSSKNGKWSAAF